MKSVCIIDDLEGEKLKELLLFVIGKSNKMSLERVYRGKLTDEEFNQMQVQYKEFIFDEDKKRRLYYKENINGYRERINKYYSGETKAEKYFDAVLEQELENYKSINHQDFNNGNFKPYCGKTSDLLNVSFTRIRPTGYGGVSEICYFKLGDTVRKVISNMHKLFQYPHYIENTKFEDLTFYKGERVVLAICQHEGFANLNFEDDEYEEFSKLSIIQNIIE
jgi:protein-arginine kinase activator protein McsA